MKYMLTSTLFNYMYFQFNARGNYGQHNQVRICIRDGDESSVSQILYE